MYMSLFSTCGWILRLGVTVALLMSIHPALALLAAFALPTVLTSTWRPGVERAAEERGAPANRLARHLFVTATTAPPGKEVRVTGIGDRLVADRRAAWERWYGPVAAARWESAWWHTLAWAVFGAGFVGAVVFVASVLHATPGNVLLVLAAGSRLSAYIGATVGEIGFLRGIWLDGSRRLAWLEDYAAALTEHCRCAGAGAARGRDSLRARLLRLSRHGAPRARGRLPGPQARLRGGHRRRERRRQDHAREALVPAVPADERAHPRGRTSISRACPPMRGGRGSPARFRISSGSSSGRGRPSASAMSPASTTSPRWWRPSTARARDDVVARLAAGLETQLGPTWPERRGGQLRPVAEARPGPRLHARSPAAPGAR